SLCASCQRQKRQENRKREQRPHLGAPPQTEPREEGVHSCRFLNRYPTSRVSESFCGDATGETQGWERANGAGSIPGGAVGKRSDVVLCGAVTSERAGSPCSCSRQVILEQPV